MKCRPIYRKLVLIHKILIKYFQCINFKFTKINHITDYICHLTCQFANPFDTSRIDF